MIRQIFPAGARNTNRRGARRHLAFALAGCALLSLQLSLATRPAHAGSGGAIAGALIGGIGAAILLDAMAQQQAEAQRRARQQQQKQQKPAQNKPKTPPKTQQATQPPTQAPVAATPAPAPAPAPTPANQPLPTQMASPPPSMVVPTSNVRLNTPSEGPGSTGTTPSQPVKLMSEPLF